MSAALLPLFAAVPLLCAGLLVVARAPGLARALAVGVPAASAAGGVALLAAHATRPVLAHGVGAFAPGVAIPFVSDHLSAVMITVTGLVCTTCAVFLALTGEDRYRFVPSLLLLLVGGVNGALLTGDLFNLFVFIEVMLLPSYALIAVTGTWRRLGVGRLFVLVNLMTSTLLLIGVGFVYGVAGTVNLAALSGRAAHDDRLGLAVALVLVALAVKSGVVPVHGWLPRTYPATSAGVMALFSALHTKVALYAVYRIYATLYGGQAAPWWPVLAALVVLTMLVGALATAGERRVRSVLAYQMVSGVGHILVGLVILSAAALAAGLFYLVHHIVTMAALLLLAGAIEQTYGSGRCDRLSGLMRREPVIASGLALGLLSLVGLPPTSGLWGKVGLVAAAAAAPAAQAWSVIGAIILASLVSLLALQHLWRQICWGPAMSTYRPDSPATGRGPRTALPEQVRVPTRLALPGLLLVAASVAMFVTAGLLWPLAADAAAGLLDPAPYVEAVLR